MTWPPQRSVWVAIVISILALLVCAAALVVDPRRRAGEARGPVPAISLLWPLQAENRLVSGWRAGLAIAGAGVAGWLLATPWVGLAMAGAMLLSLRLALGRPRRPPRARWWCSSAPACTSSPSR